jgi:acetyl esterase/lipase
MKLSLLCAVFLSLFVITIAGREVLQNPPQSSTNQTTANQPPALPLWPGGAPGAKGAQPEDVPSIQHYPAPADKANGAAIVVCPGGGYGRLAPHEGHDVAVWLNTIGVSAFVLKYRLGPRYNHPAMLWDVQRAIRTVRAKATDWKVDPNRIGVMGFSAGGHLSSTAATHFDDGNATATDPIDRVSSRPDVAILCYPVITLQPPFAHMGSRKNLLGENPPAELVDLMSNEKQVTARTPPTFLFHTVDDAGVPVENSMLFAEALRKYKVPHETHFYEHGRHGVGLAKDDPALSTWPKMLENWLRARGFFTATKKAEAPPKKADRRS